MTPRTSADERVCVGRIGAAHGTRGEVKLWSYTADPLAIADYGPLESKDGAHTLHIAALRSVKGGLVARLQGFNDRTAAEQLRNLDLYVPRDRLPPVEAQDEFYHSDLIGLLAVDAGGKRLGAVVAVHNFGAGDLIEIAPAGGGASVMLPFTDRIVPLVDIAGRRIVLNPPAGTLPPGQPAAED
jgi:16S rRNA processing protein RimM